ncbi:MAG: hypothetical protein QHI48_06735 [Bacteroidota bacterium]|nr:hypothetical protein [Bacteroidota bacterium]
MKRAAVILFLCVSNAAAQNGASALSRFGIGDLDNLATARQRGMGYVAAPLTSTFDISVVNPAAWSSIDRLRLGGNLSYEYESSSRGSDLSAGSLGFKSLHLAVPLEEGWKSRLVLGFQSLSSVDYRLVATGNAGGETYRAEYGGHGGLGYLTMGAGLRPMKSLYIGAAYRWYLGTIDHEGKVTFTNTSTFFHSYQRRSTSHSGGGWSGGLLWTGLKRLAVGFSVASGAGLRAVRDFTVQYSTHDSTLRSEEGRQDLPLRVQLGMAWQYSDALLVGFDGAYQDWTNAVVFHSAQPELTSSFRVGVGVEWHPWKENGKPSMRRMCFRFGAAHQKLAVLLEGNGQKETFVTAGFGFPVFGESMGDVALEAGVRGAADELLGRRILLRLSLAVNVGEAWFIRRDVE